MAPAGSVEVGQGVGLWETDEGGSVFVWGMAVSVWDGGDVVGRRLAAVQLVETRAAGHGEVAIAFGVGQVTLWRWRQAWRADGVSGLAPGVKGPKRASKLTEAKVAEIAAARAEGLSMRAIAARVGVSPDSVLRALGPRPSGPPAQGPSAEPTELVALARPEPRTAEREAARGGALAEAEPQICEGAGLPLAGALVILPALVATGLLEVAGQTYGRTRAAFYGLRSLVLTLMFAALLGEPRAEGLTRIDPVDVGRLLGLDRAPEVKTIRRRIEALAGEHRADRLLGGLAARHAAAHDQAMGVLYVDGHVRAYHGGADVAKAHVARIRLSMPAEVDTWVADANGDGLLVWSAPPGASLVGELRRVATEVRALVGADRRPTIAFDRGGWSPTLFAELTAAGFDILTYRKAPCRAEPRSAFTRHVFTDDRGRRQEYWLADRAVRISYKDKNRTRRFACRQITRLDPATGHQTQVLTTRTDPDPAGLAYAMFSRWRQENFFRYLRAHYALDGLDAYTTTADDPTRLVPNPARRQADRDLREARARLVAAEAEEGRASVEGRRTKAATAEMAAAFAAARAEIARLATAARAIPAKAPLGDSHPQAARLDPERKRIHDAIRMATYNAESATARLLAPHYARADDEARSLLREIFASPADLQVINRELHVRVNPLSAPRRTRALAGLCADLTATRTTYPGTDLTLVYAVKDR
jgi:prepilin-type processing-associated H-X9-DG protein